MPRPSQQLDEAMLASGRALFPAAGCAGLSVRAVAEHAGARPAMFHYHFGSKDAFLRTLLQRMYDEMYTQLAHTVQAEGPALQRLRAGLMTLGGVVRTRRRLLARVWMDAMAGEPVAVAFFRDNAPRHLGLLFGLLAQAQAEGTLRELPPLQRFAFTMGAVLLPMVFIAGLAEAAALPALPASHVHDQVLSDEALAQRIDLALAALTNPAPPAPATARARQRTPRKATP